MNIFLSQISMYAPFMGGRLFADFPLLFLAEQSVRSLCVDCALYMGIPSPAGPAKSVILRLKPVVNRSALLWGIPTCQGVLFRGKTRPEWSVETAANDTNHPHLVWKRRSRCSCFQLHLDCFVHLSGCPSVNKRCKLITKTSVIVRQNSFEQNSPAFFRHIESV